MDISFQVIAITASVNVLLFESFYWLRRSIFQDLQNNSALINFSQFISIVYQSIFYSISIHLQVMAESSNVLRSRKQVVSMLATVVVFFFACMMPFKIFVLWIITLQVDVTEVISLETYHLLLYFCRVMFYINSAINPILYNIMSSKFREGFRKVFHCVEWPLTPQRLRLTAHPASSNHPSSGIRRKTTVSSSLQVHTVRYLQFLDSFREKLHNYTLARISNDVRISGRQSRSDLF